MGYRIKISFIAGCAAAVSAFVAEPTGRATVAAAQETSDAKLRVNLAGRQRMLTQRMTKAVCFAAADIDRDRHIEMIRVSHDDFDRALAALHHGDEALGVYGPETSARILKGLREVENRWMVFGAAIREVVENGAFSDENIQTIYTKNLPLLAKMNEVVSHIEQAYANPNEMLLGDAIAINIAGRQRMLTQKIGKETCLSQSGWNADASREALAKTVAMFEASHRALLNGMPAAGVIPPPSPGIADDLAALEMAWREAKPTVETVVRGAIISPERIAGFARKSDYLLNAMHAIVGRYEKVQ